jgi:hypothetical protein
VSFLHAIKDWLISWGIVGICVIAVVFLLIRCGFPLKHRTLPSFDSVLLVLLGAITAVSGIKLLSNIRTINVPSDLYISIIIGGFASAWAGLHSLISGFNRGVSESPVPPPKKTAEGETDSITNNEPE